MIHYVDSELRLHSSGSAGEKIHIVSGQQRCMRLRLQPSGKWLRCPFKAKHAIVSLTIHNLTQEVIHRTQIQWTSLAAGSRQQNGGSTEQWENVPVCSLEHPNAHKHNADVERTHKYCTKRCHVPNLQRSCMHTFHSVMTFWCWQDLEIIAEILKQKRCDDLSIAGTAGKPKTWIFGTDPSRGASPQNTWHSPLSNLPPELGLDPRLVLKKEKRFSCQLFIPLFSFSIIYKARGNNRVVV